MAATTEQQIQELAASPGPVLIIGPDEVRTQRAALMLCRAFLGETSPAAENQLQIDRRDAAALNQADLRRLADDVLSIGLFASRRCIIVKNAQDRKSVV